MIPELIGRLPIITPLLPLDTATLVRILTEPKNALVRQYQHFFGIEDAELSFTDGALQGLASKAISRETGARALRSVMEELMLDLMYDLPEIGIGGAKYVIDESAVAGEKTLAELDIAKKKESA